MGSQPFTGRHFKCLLFALKKTSPLRQRCAAREFYEKPTAELKRKKAAAVKRHYKRVRSMMLPKRKY